MEISSWKPTSVEVMGGEETISVISSQMHDPLLNVSSNPKSNSNPNHISKECHSHENSHQVQAPMGNLVVPSPMVVPRGASIHLDLYGASLRLPVLDVGVPLHVLRRHLYLGYEVITMPTTHKKIKCQLPELRQYQWEYLPESDIYTLHVGLDFYTLRRDRPYSWTFVCECGDNVAGEQLSYTMFKDAALKAESIIVRKMRHIAADVSREATKAQLHRTKAGIRRQFRMEGSD